MSSYVCTGWETGFFQSPNCIFDEKDLSIHEKVCYLYLCRLADGERKSFPSYSTMAEKMSVSRPTAIKSVKSLEDKGYLLVERRRLGKDKNLSNIYTVIHPDQVIHSGKGDLPEQVIGKGGLPGVVKEVYQGSKGGLLKKDSFKNTQFKKDIYTEVANREFQFFDWVNK